MLEIKNLTKTYKKVKAVDQLNMTIRDGEFFGLLGPNGAGKTTVVRMISTVTPKTAGEIIIDGDSIDRNLIEIKAKIGVVPQINNLENETSAWENLEVHGILYGIEKEKRRKKIDELFEFIELTERKNDLVRTYSGGMERKLMIARAILHEPELLLLDEPTVGLDASARRKMWDLLKRLRSNGLTVLLTTHYIEEAEALCDRVGLIDKGKLIKMDTPENLIEEVGKITVEYFSSGETHEVFFKSREEANSYVGGLKGDVRIRPSNLEDVFLKVTNRRVEEV